MLKYFFLFFIISITTFKISANDIENINALQKLNEKVDQGEEINVDQWKDIISLLPENIQPAWYGQLLTRFDQKEEINVDQWKDIISLMPENIQPVWIFRLEQKSNE